MKSNNTYIKIVAILMVCIVSLQLTGCGRYADLQNNNTSSAGRYLLLFHLILKQKKHLRFLRNRLN
jgi:hypothetical protein